MPKFDNNNKKRPGQSVAATTKAPIIVEPKCLVCKSPHRHLVDQMLVAGLTFSEIERQFEFAGLKRRSIAGHKEKHLGYEDAAIRHVIEEQAVAAQRNFEEGTSRLVTKNAYLEVALQKAYDALIKDITIVEPKDAVKVIEMLQKLQEQSQGAAIDELRQQFNWFMQSVKETVPKNQWETIVDRTEQLAGRKPPSLPIPEQIVDATVVA